MKRPAKCGQLYHENGYWHPTPCSMDDGETMMYALKGKESQQVQPLRSLWLKLYLDTTTEMMARGHPYHFGVWRDLFSRNRLAKSAFYVTLVGFDRQSVCCLLTMTSNGFSGVGCKNLDFQTEICFDRFSNVGFYLKVI